MWFLVFCSNISCFSGESTPHRSSQAIKEGQTTLLHKLQVFRGDSLATEGTGLAGPFAA